MPQIDNDSKLPYINDTGWCPKCKAITGFDRNHTVRQIWPREVIIGGQAGPKLSSDAKTIRILMCLVCRETVTLLESRVPSESKLRGEIVESRVIFPPVQVNGVDESVPIEIGNLFQEGAVCESVGAFIAAAAVYRACVEKICIDKGTSGRNLYDRIESLKSVLGSNDALADDMHEARLLGNSSLHEGLAFSQEEVRDVAELIHEALIILYVQPEQRRKMRAQREARRKG